MEGADFISIPYKKGSILLFPAEHDPRAGDAGLVGPRALRAEIAPGQVEELAADLRRGQAEEVGGRRRLDLLQGTAEPQDRVLEHVVGLLPAMDAREIPEHLPRQAGQPVHRVDQQLVARRGVARPQAIDAPLDLRRTLVLGHEDAAPEYPNSLS